MFFDGFGCRQAGNYLKLLSGNSSLRRRPADGVYCQHRQRFFTRMSVRLSRPAICGSRARFNRTPRPASAPAGQPKRAGPRDSFRPFALSLIGLAVTVALWGYSYRISRYSAVRFSKTFVARLWVENRLAIAAEHVTARNSLKHFGADADAIPVAAVRMPASGRVVVLSPQSRLRPLLRLVFPTPLRSPPALLSL